MTHIRPSRVGTYLYGRTDWTERGPRSSHVRFFRTFSKVLPHVAMSFFPHRMPLSLVHSFHDNQANSSAYYIVVLSYDPFNGSVARLTGVGNNSTSQSVPSMMMQQCNCTYSLMVQQCWATEGCGLQCVNMTYCVCVYEGIAYAMRQMVRLGFHICDRLISESPHDLRQSGILFTFSRPYLFFLYIFL